MIFFYILTEIYENYGFFTKPGYVFNMGETEFQLHNEVGKVIAVPNMSTHTH